ncbi:cellulose binding domain-containing protein [Myceligenerans salitolerans]|uniref:Cellulose binding domain-containing protein n=1 Tax=Myceligenerans salitolerans TaxID=1230528 RepID=A0ABS3IBJ4_9MICO|nr:cellulose binding domain-containing protein [Myceligenerans salitolerans]MBO0609808.1 cellulose binding domain-containing protein [Myceligenerans salitolerans]
MRHLTTSGGRRLVPAALAALLALGGLTAPSWAAPEQDAAALDGTAGCGRSAGLSTGNHTIMSGGRSRTFRLDVPTGYDPNHPYRLVVGLHWWHGTSQDVVNQNFYGLEPLAEGSTVFVAPQGIDNAWPNTNGQDVAFVDDVLRTVEDALCIDTTQRFATGFSYGGGMSNALACARADVFRAVAVLNGAQLSGCAGGTQPIAYLGSHGVVDDVLNISQGRALRDRFLQTNGCQAQQAPEPAPGSGTHVKTTYTCRDGFPVVWIASDSGHQWDARDGGQQQSWVPGEIWRFFTSLTSTTPSPSPTPTSDPTTTPPPAGDCTATYRTVNSWPGGYQGEVTVETGSPSTSWSVSWPLSGGTVDQVWNGSMTSQGDIVTVRNADWNGTLPAGGGTTFGLLGSGTPPASPLTCTSS